MPKIFESMLYFQCVAISYPALCHFEVTVV